MKFVSKKIVRHSFSADPTTLELIEFRVWCEYHTTDVLELLLKNMCADIERVQNPHSLWMRMMQNRRAALVAEIMRR